jgi:hypothetical protein
MNEDEKMFRIGLAMFVLMIIVTVALQVCYRTQNTERKRVRAQIVQTQQEIAVAQANFASQVRPESLRNLVSGVVPRAEAISFSKSVDVQDLQNSVDE